MAQALKKEEAAALIAENNRLREDLIQASYKVADAVAGHSTMTLPYTFALTLRALEQAVKAYRREPAR